MTTEQREQLREVLIDHIRLLSLDKKYYTEMVYNRKVAQVRLLLKEVA
jgi:hypothetical protein